MEIKLYFFIVAAGVLFAFCFRLNTFTSKISNLLSPLGAERVGVANLDVTYFSLLLLVAFVLTHTQNIYRKYTKY